MGTSNSAPPAEEHILAVIGGLTRISGFMGFKQQVFTLIITNHRLIFAELDKGRLSALTRESRDHARAQGKGLWGQWGAQRRALGDYEEIYWQMAPAQALAESPNNFAVDRASIKKIRFKTGVVDDERSTSDRIIIKTTGKKHTLQVRGVLSSTKEAFRTAGLI